MLSRINQTTSQPHSFSISAGNNIQLAGDVSAVTTLATRAVYIKAAFSQILFLQLLPQRENGGHKQQVNHSGCYSKRVARRCKKSSENCQYPLCQI